MKIQLLLSLLLASCTLCAQSWSSLELADIPMRTSNNAVTGGTVNTATYVFSFGGIDSTKLWSGIHLRSFRYHIDSDFWSEIPALPDSMGKIAMGASTVKNKIYIIGGYHVFSDQTEISSNKVHIYNPQTNAYEPDGAIVPIPIDDHVQAVYKDSLIFVVSGWSNSGNVNKVQIYDPVSNSWAAGTDMPNTSSYKVFGASGVIVGDTLYYAGGASDGGNFPLVSFLRKGYIDPAQPDSIVWSASVELLGKGYRAASASLSGQVLWFGGARQSYNYNGIAYAGGGVSPENRIVTYDPILGQLSEDSGAMPAVMDLRGVAELGNGKYIIAGGMGSGQEVLNSTYQLSFGFGSGIAEQIVGSQIPVRLCGKQLNLKLSEAGAYEVFDITGRSRMRLYLMRGQNQVDTSMLHDGWYFMKGPRGKITRIFKVDFYE